jgi:hypothetical protein
MAMLAVAKGSRVREIRGMRAALALQGLHVAEHVALTPSVSTGFGTMSGASLFAYRIWFHFVVNLGATILAVTAFVSMNNRGHFSDLVPRGRTSQRMSEARA